MSRIVRVSAIQTGPLFPEKEKNLSYNLGLIDKAAKSEPDYIALPELSTTQFFCVGLHDKGFFNLAEEVPGKTTELFAKKAKEYGTSIVLPVFEKGDVEGEYYDSVVVIDENGELVPGQLPDGLHIKSARKNYISDFRWGTNQLNDEKYYFKVGSGHPIFKTKKSVIGILICYERWYPEAWRVLSLQGAEINFVANASAGFVSENAICLLKANAAMNAVYCVCVNKGGIEKVAEVEVDYYGLSAIIDPKGNVIAQTEKNQSEAILSAELDLDKVHEARLDLFVYRDRRPEFYRIISESVRDYSH